MRSFRIHVFILSCVLSIGCGGDERSAVGTNQGDTTTLDQDRDVVVIAGRRGDVVIEGRGQGCVEVGQTCVDASEAESRYCKGEDAHADIVVDEDGEVLSVLCYPSVEEAANAEDVLVNEEGVATLPQNKNGAVLTFPKETDNVPIKGDLKLKAERAILVGRGMGVTLLEGALEVDSNNARVRGLRVNEDLKISSNGVGVSFVRVLGSLKVDGNNFVGMTMKVFGDVDITGNGAVLHNIGVQGQWKAASGVACVGCYSFSDDNANALIEDAEIGDGPLVP